MKKSITLLTGLLITSFALAQNVFNKGTLIGAEGFGRNEQ